MSVTATRHGWRIACDWLVGCSRITVLHNEHVDEVRDTIAERGWTRGKRDTDYCPDHSGKPRPFHPPAEAANAYVPECPACGAAPGQAHDPTCKMPPVGQHYLACPRATMVSPTAECHCAQLAKGMPDA